MPDEKHRPWRILIVDDEPVVREIIRNTLESPRVYMVDAANGEEAISLLLVEHFDLVIVDKNLPGITGMDVIRRAKATHNKIGILLITAYASRESAEEAMAVGVDDYIVKPFDLNDLREKVNQALERRAKRLPVKRRQSRQGARKRVLICEPEGQEKEIIKEAITNLGCHSISVAKVSELLDVIRQKEFDSLICDLELLNRDNAAACFLRSVLLVKQDMHFIVVAKTRGLEEAVLAVHYGARKVLYRPLRNTTRLTEELQQFLSSPL